MDSFSATGTRMIAGLSGASAQTDPTQGVATWRYHVGLGYDAGSLVRPTVGAVLAGERIAIAAPEVSRPFAQVSATGTYPLGKASYLYYGVNGEARRGQSEVGLHGGMRVSF